MKQFIVCATLLLSSSILFSQEVSQSLAVKMANLYFQNIDSRNRKTYNNDDSLYIAHQLSAPERFSPNGKADMWLVPVVDGWVILSGSMKATPILAYIPSFEKPVYDAMPPAAQELLDSYEDYLVYIRDNDSWYEIDSRWLEAQKNAETESGMNRTIIYQTDTLLTVKWGQSGGGTCATNKIYNKYCPIVANPNICNKAYVGCVAVAISQIMWYWNWPYAAQVPQSIGGDDTTLIFYDWEKMPETINNSTEMENVDMIAGFLRDCGYKLNMDYGPNGSSAYYIDAAETLKAFGYDRDSIALRYKWNTSGWTNMLRSNIDNGYPVFYAGSKTVSGTGHAFVVDGYQTGSATYHINWGWKGRYNGWYNIDDAYINDSTHYEHYQQAIFGIRPDPRFCGAKTITTVESPKFCIAQAGTVTLDGVQMSNISDGRVYSAESIILTNGTYISSGCNVLFDIKSMHCYENQGPDSYLEEAPPIIPHSPHKQNVINDPPSASKILRDGQILILRDGKTYTITGLQIQ